MQSKRKSNPKVEERKAIDPAILEEILGGVPPNGAGNGAVIPQAPFSSFYHS